jgi:sugar phosphate isomerase/epimerase
MVEFRTEYYTPMDRGYHAPQEFDQLRPTANIEEPILPIAQLGQTVPEHGRTQNILQNVQAAIRAGTGNLQIVFETPVESALGGRPKAYGEEVRQALKEIALANEVMVTGMEMPTSLNNLSGWDPQRGIVDETKRQRDLDEVKDMIRFAAEVGQGGGVDIVSWEYDRPVHRAKWIKDDKIAQDAFARAIAEEAHKEEVRFVDTRSGQIGAIPIREGIPMFIKKISPGRYEELDVLEDKPVLWKYKDFEEYAKATNQEVHDLIKKKFLEEQLKVAQAQEGYYRKLYTEAEDSFVTISKEIAKIKRGEAPGIRIPEEHRDNPLPYLEERKAFLNGLMESYHAGLEEQKRVYMQNQLRIENWKPIEQVTLDRSKLSYAEAGIAAMQLQEQRAKDLRKNLYVGPEIGWPNFYGSHPKEFADMILGARQQMVKILTDDFTADSEMKGSFKKYGFQRPLDKEHAREEARKHIKGTFDTGHMGMWLQQFHPELPWDERLKKFKKWYGEQINWLADLNRKEQVIGAIQAVDSAGPGHGHLPPGQGILPVKDAVEMLKTKGGFTGYVVSEGHEEEKFGQGRILLKTWQNFGSPLATGYTPGFPQRTWGQVQNAYFGRTYSPLFMFGSYAPSNEFKLWSEVPLE